MTLNIGPHIVTDLKDRIEELEEEIADLRKLLAIDESADWLMKAGFSPAESRMLSMMLAKDIVSRRQLAYAATPTTGRHELASDSMVGVHLHAINRKLRPLGVSYTTIHGRGVYLSPQAKAVIRGLQMGTFRAAAE